MSNTTSQPLKATDYQIVNNGDSALTLIFSQGAGPQLTRLILQIAEHLSTQLNPAPVEIIPAYQSLTLCFTPGQSLKKAGKEIDAKLQHFQPQFIKDSGRLVEIPVCYEDEYAPDIELVAERAGLSRQQVISLHTEPEYLVNMLGFLPGFFYLSGLNEQIHCPRKSSPSLQVPAGAIGIGGSQTGVYPVNSPGGWNIIGRTPVKVFAPGSETPFIVEPLDKVQFVAIDHNEFQRLSKDGAK